MKPKYLRCDIQGYPLSYCEWGVLICAALGYKNIVTGKELHMAESTVKNHMVSITRKLGASNRAQAVTIGFRLGYLA